MTNQPNQQITKPITRKKEIRDFLEGADFKLQIQRAMPTGMSVDRFIRIAITATIRNPKLLNCTQESFFKCLMDLSAMGLEPDGRRAHLIPYGDQCTLIVDYKGVAELVRRNGDVSTIHCDVVGKNDQFICRFGTGGKLEHSPNIVDRGEIYAVYSYVKLKDGGEEWDVMSAVEVEKIRARSRSANNGPWVTDWPEMAKKTVFRRHSKTLPLSPETRAAVEYDEDNEFSRFANATPARTPKSSVLGDIGGNGGSTEDSDDKEAGKGDSGAAPGNLVAGAGVAAAAAAAKKEVAPKKESKPAQPSRAEQLAALLKDAGIGWSQYAAWITTLTRIPVPAQPKDLPLNILSDCVSNFDANREAFDQWVAQTEKGEAV